MSENFGKWMITLGLVIIVLGLIVWGLGKIIPIGKLPGDLSYRSEKVGIYFPIATSIVLSLLLTIIINLILWLKNRS